MTNNPSASGPDFDRMEGTLLTRVRTAHNHRVRKHWALTVAVVVLAGGGAGIGAVVTANSAMQSNSAYCYAAPQTSARYAQVAGATDRRDADGTMRPVAQGRATPQSAMEKCSALWSGGFFDGPASSNSLSTHPVPALRACRRSDQVFDVFPTADSDPRSAAQFCADLGLDFIP